MRSLTSRIAKFFRLSLKRRRAYPAEIQVEVTNACNLKCAMCPHTLGFVPQEHFPMEGFERLAAQNPPPLRLVLTGWGEPLLHPQFFDLVALANRFWPSTAVRFTTNGTLIDARVRERMRSLELDAVTVSVDLAPGSTGWSPEWKEILHPPSPRVMRLLEDYTLDAELARKTVLVLQCLLVPDNQEDLRFFIDWAAGRPVHSINLVRMQRYDAAQPERLDWEEEQRRLAELIRRGRDRGVVVRTINRQPPWIRIATHGDRYCVRTDDSLYITISGTCTPCCNLRDYSIGALAEKGFQIAEAWNSSAEQSFFHCQAPVCGACDALFHHYKNESNQPAAAFSDPSVTVR